MADHMYLSNVNGPKTCHQKVIARKRGAETCPPWH